MGIYELSCIKHATEKGKRVRELVERGVCSNEGIEKKSALAVGQVEEVSGLSQLLAGSICRDKFRANEIIAVNAASDCLGVDLNEN